LIGLFASALFLIGLFTSALFLIGLFASALFLIGLFASALFLIGLFASALSLIGLFASVQFVPHFGRLDTRRQANQQALRVWGGGPEFERAREAGAGDPRSQV